MRNGVAKGEIEENILIPFPQDSTIAFSDLPEFVESVL